MSEAIKVLCDGVGKLAGENQQLRELITAAQKMRDSQKLYFETKDRGVMMQCKDLEKKFDLALDRAKRELSE